MTGRDFKRDRVAVASRLSDMEDFWQTLEALDKVLEGLREDDASQHTVMLPYSTTPSVSSDRWRTRGVDDARDRPNATR